MTLINRRSTITGAVATVATMSALTATSGMFTAAQRGNMGAEPILPSGVENPLPIPPLEEGEMIDGVRQFNLELQTGSMSFLPGVTTPTWGVNGPFLGPTLHLLTGETVQVNVTNNLAEFTTIHWHGMLLPAQMDGGPHIAIEPTETWSPTWTVENPAATLWYHPHPHGVTAFHTWRGIAGLIVVDDPGTDATLPSEYGVDDIPLVIQDRAFSADGTLRESRGGMIGLTGDTLLVNGVAGAVFDVTRDLIRFRILNGSNTRWYNLQFADGRPMQLISTDSGFVEGEAIEVDTVMLSPGERAEIVVAFAPGEQVALRSVALDFSGGAVYGLGSEFDVLTMRAGSVLEPGVAPVFPAGVRPDVDLDTLTLRQFALGAHDRINDRAMDMTWISEVCPASVLELWEIWSDGTWAHNFHVHASHFHVLSIGDAEPPPSIRGPKDTVVIPQDGSVVRILIQIGRHKDTEYPYMFHCHLLRHEDAGMMGQFLTVEPGTELDVDRVIEDHSGH